MHLYQWYDVECIFFFQGLFQRVGAPLVVATAPFTVSFEKVLLSFTCATVFLDDLLQYLCARSHTIHQGLNMLRNQGATFLCVRFFRNSQVRENGLLCRAPSRARRTQESTLKIKCCKDLLSPKSASVPASLESKKKQTQEG